MTPTTKPALRKIAVRKAGTVRLTAAAAALYTDGCGPTWPIPF
jgi:hypothetical protein